ncbi:MAG TPA: hypothetical protein VGL71_07405 [Urbifossiella sp.]|jgi:hypothetical protein
MILGIEIAMIIVGLVALIRGKMTITKSKVVEGLPARLLGLVALTPIPIALTVGVAFVLIAAPNNPEKFAEDNKWTLTLIEVVIVIGIAIVVFGVGAIIAEPPRQLKRRRRYEEYDDDNEDDYDDDRQRGKNRYEIDDDSEDEDDRPRKRRSRDDYDDDDERPRRRR